MVAEPGSSHEGAVGVAEAAPKPKAPAETEAEEEDDPFEDALQEVQDPDVLVDEGWHEHMLTRLPKRKDCIVCQKAKAHLKPFKRCAKPRNVEDIPPLEKFGDVVCSDFVVISEKKGYSVDKHGYLLTCYDVYTGWVNPFPHMVGKLARRSRSSNDFIRIRSSGMRASCLRIMPRSTLQLPSISGFVMTQHLLTGIRPTVESRPRTAR